MPTLSAIQLDRYLEQGESKTTSSKKVLEDATKFAKLERRNTTPFLNDDLKISSKNKDIPPPYPNLRRRNSTSSPAAVKMLPALYATPEPTPLPDSPMSSFPPSSPFLINHKRRGPRLLKSLSHQNVAEVSGGGHVRSLSEEGLEVESREEEVNSREEEVVESREEGDSKGEVKVEFEGGEGCKNGDCLVRENVENEDFFDPQESLSFSGTVDSDDVVGERSSKAMTSMGEFFDAWEELSSDSGMQSQQRSLNDIETELREMRLSLLMEIEKRKQAEETLQVMQQQWQILREKLGAIGLMLPADLTALMEDSQSDGPVEEICRQIQLTRFVSESIGRGLAKAEAQAEMEAQLEVKNFEIARLFDRLHYYETMNQEMSQRNQETIEMARQERQKRRRRQKWIWGTLGTTAITLGAVLAWSYLPSGKGSSSSEVSRTNTNVK